MTFTTALAVTFLAASCAADDFAPVDFETIRAQSLQNRSVVPAVPVPSERNYQSIIGPGYVFPLKIIEALPPNLTAAQKDVLLERLHELQKRNPSAAPPNKIQLKRLIKGLDSIDLFFVDPLSRKRWDQILSSIGDAAEQEFPDHGTWDEVVDRMMQTAVLQLKDPHDKYFAPEPHRKAGVAHKTMGVCDVARHDEVRSRLFASTVIYVHFACFSAGVDQRLIDAVHARENQGGRSVIIDLRGNEGGEVAVLSRIASEFLHAQDDIIFFKHQGQLVEKKQTVADGEFSRLPVAVLIDRRTVSAAEALASALKEWRNAFIVGTRSYGKGTEQIFLPQGQGRTLKITENHWYTPDGNSIEAEHDPETGEEKPGTGGVVPNLPIIAKARTSDPALETAIGALAPGDSK